MWLSKSFSISAERDLPTVSVMFKKGRLNLR
jgi:hypothetical protein